MDLVQNAAELLDPQHPLHAAFAAWVSARMSRANLPESFRTLLDQLEQDYTGVKS